jgi:hypothetical protein
VPCIGHIFIAGPSMHENQGEKGVANWRRFHIQAGSEDSDPGPFPLAAPNRRSDPFLSLLVQPCGRLPGLSCKVHSGKGLPRRR